MLHAQPSDSWPPGSTSELCESEPFQHHAETLPVSAARQNNTATSGTSLVSVSFELHDDFLIVLQGSIGGLGPLKFILDTGTTTSMIDSKVAEKLSLPLVQGRVHSLERQVPISWTTLPELQIGPFHASDLRVMVGSLAQVSELAGTFDGVLGLDLLRRSQRMQIDFATQHIVFRMPAANPWAIGHPPSTRIAFFVPLSIHGARVRVMLDTGARDLFLFKGRLRRSVPAVHWTGNASATSGRLHGEFVRFNDLKAGDIELNGSVFLLDDAPQALPDDVDGVLGPRFLHASLIDFDFEAGAFRFGGVRNTPTTTTASSPDARHDQTTAQVRAPASLTLPVQF